MAVEAFGCLHIPVMTFAGSRRCAGRLPGEALPVHQAIDGGYSVL